MAHALTRTHFIAPKELIEETDRLVGARRRSQFIAEAVAEKLKREKLLRLTREVMKLPPDEEVTPGWETPEAVSRWVRDQRVDTKPIRKV